MVNLRGLDAHYMDFYKSLPPDFNAITGTGGDCIAKVTGTNFIGLAIGIVIGIIVFAEVLVPVVEEFTGGENADPTLVALVSIIPIAFAAGLIYFVLKANNMG